MPKVTGVYDAFSELDQIPIEDIARWLSPLPDYYLENYVANRISYPPAVPGSVSDLEIELALLREALIRYPSQFSPQAKKIYIPEGFIARFADLTKLAWAFVDAYNPKEMVLVVKVTDQGEKILGSVITPQIRQPKGVVEINVENKNYELNIGSSISIPCATTHCHLSFKSDFAKLMDKNDIMMEVYGGDLGLLIDGRGK